MRTPTLLASLLLAACAVTTTTETNPMIEGVSTGEFWYRLNDENGKPQGYARMSIGTPEGGGLAVDWELKIAWSGGAYVESRTLALDADGRLTSADYRVGGKTVSEAARSGEWLKGYAVEGEVKADIELKIPDDAITGMLFVLCPGVLLEAGGELTFQELDEANGFAPLGPTKIVYGGPETLLWEGTKLAVHRVNIQKSQGEGMPVWVTGDGRIAKSDWGGGNVMVLSSSPTNHLFDPKPPAVAEVPGEPDRLVVAGSFPAFTPQEMFDHFTKDDLLTKWWAIKATVDLTPGGDYVLEWPEQEWTLRGTVKAFTPGERFVFTWAWDHMPDAPTRTVTVVFAARDGGGTDLTVTHEAYGEGEDEAKERDGHLAGWTAILSRLRDVR